MPTRVQTMVQLTDELVRLLDRRAAGEGRSRSQIIREAVEAYLAADREALIDEQIIAGYSRMPQSGELEVDEWGDMGRLTTALAAETMRALEEEEREAGLESW